MLLQSPSGLHYPITVTELLKRPGDDIDKATPLFAYSYKTTVTEGDRYGEERQVERTFPTRFESPADGSIVSWHIARGDVLNAAGVSLAEIEEPCTHDIQFAGMCVKCGKYMDEYVPVKLYTWLTS